MILKYLAILISVFCVCGSTLKTKNGEDTQLELVQIVFRHGDRTPVVIYPHDIYNATHWDMYGGLGQLTQTGMLQHNEYGLYLRNRYSKFLSEFYNKDQVYVRSTDYDRTVMSAQSLLSSLYTPTGYQVWKKDVNWQPIPVHTTDADKIFANPDHCERYKELKLEVCDTEEYKKLTLKYKVI
jgi:hypothetical protein